ncbi:MAG: glycosyltransferase family 4 protein [Ktedonobacteraceae bacterium]
MDRYQRTTQPKIAFLLSSFPSLSETFILQEILELEHQGLPLRLFSLSEPSTAKLAGGQWYGQASITYISRCSTLTLLAAGARRFLKAPWHSLRTGIVMIAHYRQRSVPRCLLYAAYLADQLEREGLTHLHAHYATEPTSVAQATYLLTGIDYSFTAHAYDIYLSPTHVLAYKMQMANFIVTCTAYNRHYLASPRILTVARLVEKKGVSYLLRACRILKDQHCKFTCRIVGDGPLRQVLEREIRALELTDTVELWGAATHKQVIEMYQQAAITVLPSIIGKNGDRDGIPNVLVESLWMSVPVVSTPVSGIPELISSEINGLLVPPHDSVALAAALARLLDDPLLRCRLAAAGRETVLARFDMAQNATRLIHLFCADRGAEIV